MILPVGDAYFNIIIHTNRHNVRCFFKTNKSGCTKIHEFYKYIYIYIVVLMSYITGWFMLSIYRCSTGVLLHWHCGSRYDYPADCDVILEDISVNCIYMFLGMYCIFCILLHKRVSSNVCVTRHHDDVIKWKHFPRNWLFVWGIHWPPVNSPELWCFIWSASE